MNWDQVISPQAARGLLKLTLILGFGVLVLRAMWRKQ